MTSTHYKSVARVWIAMCVLVVAFPAALSAQAQPAVEAQPAPAAQSPVPAAQAAAPATPPAPAPVPPQPAAAPAPPVAPAPAAPVVTQEAPPAPPAAPAEPVAAPAEPTTLADGPSKLLIPTSSSFARFEVREGYDRLGRSRARFVEGDAFFYRARLGLQLAPIDVGGGTMVSVQFTPQASGKLGTLGSTVADAALGLHEG